MQIDCYESRDDNNIIATKKLYLAIIVLNQNYNHFYFKNMKKINFQSLLKSN